jgi:hypothetical protein
MSSFNKLKRNRPACPVILEWLESAWYHLLRPFRRTLRGHGILEKIDLFFKFFICSKIHCMPAAKSPQCTYSVRTRIAVCRKIGKNRDKKNAGNMQVLLDCDLGALSVLLSKMVK